MDALGTVLLLALLIVGIAGFWRMFEKAGKPGWAILIPIYNVIVLLSIAGKPWWWVLLFFIPLVNIAVTIVVYLDVARAFGQGIAFGIGLLLLTPIFVCIIGFSDIRYQGAPS
jgi:uncharacterized membrane protein YhaH (DUF805 family)